MNNVVGAEITKENVGTHESLIEVKKDEGNDNSILEVKYETSSECISSVEIYCLEMSFRVIGAVVTIFLKILNLKK